MVALIVELYSTLRLASKTKYLTEDRHVQRSKNRVLNAIAKYSLDALVLTLWAATLSLLTTLKFELEIYAMLMLGYIGL